MKSRTRNIILVFSVLIIASFIPAFIFSKYIEAIIFIICHTLIRPQFNKQYHHIMPEVCRIITGCVMFFGVSFVLPIEWSLISAIPINYFIGWIGCIKKERDDFEIDVERQREKIIKLLEYQKSPKEQLIEHCRAVNLNERNIHIAIMYYIDKKTPKQIWEWLCSNGEFMEYDSVYKLLNRLNKKLK